MSAHPVPVADIRADFSLLIDGAAASSSSSLDVINPATGQVFARCPAAGRDELDRAVAAARRAFPAWRDMSYAQRAERIHRLCESLKQHQDELARLLTMEQDTRYGLSGSVWSSNPDRAVALASRLEVGTAWVNHHRATSATVPFGGAKESGIGRIYSEMGLKAYLEPRVISVLKSA